jgi:hypothetical protein
VRIVSCSLCVVGLSAKDVLQIRDLCGLVHQCQYLPCAETVSNVSLVARVSKFDVELNCKAKTVPCFVLMSRR